MKIYNLDDINNFIEHKTKEKRTNNNENIIDNKEQPNKSKTQEISSINNQADDSIKNSQLSNYSINELDTAKTRILKYVMFKKRTEYEIIQKFRTTYPDDLLYEVIEILKNLGYINDENYVERTINEILILKHLSIKEIKFKLIAKGIKRNEIEKYFSIHYDELTDYEKQSAKILVKKKQNTMDEQQIKNYLIKKGYREESIKEAILT